MVSTKHPYMISIGYCDNWNPIMAGREFFANAIDTADNLSMQWKAGFANIHNESTTFKMENLLLGESGNRKNTEAIGQFGEGLKIGALVLARNNRIIYVQSGNLQFSFTIESMAGFNDIQTLSVEVTDCEFIAGTKVTWQCDESEYIESKNLFLNLQSTMPDTLFTSENGSILSEAGSIYICGVKVQSGLNWIYGYNITDKSLLNRDRNILDIYQVKNQIRRILQHCDNISIIENLIKLQYKREGNTDIEELNLGIYPHSDNYDTWKDIIEKLFGKQVCLSSTNPQSDVKAVYLGYKVIDMKEYSNGLCNCGILQYSNEIVLANTNTFVDKLDTLEKRTFNKAIKAYKLYSGCIWPDEFHVSEELPDNTMGKQQTSASGKTQILVSRNQLKEGPAMVFSILCHEGGHLSSGYSDCSSGFESAQDDIIRKMAASIIFKGH